MHNELKIHISQPYGRFGYDVFIYREDNLGNMFLQVGNKEIEMGKDGSYGSVPEGLFTFHLSEEGLALLVAQITELGIKHPDKGKVEGLYEAQSKHLQDLRSLLKLK